MDKEAAIGVGLLTLLLFSVLTPDVDVSTMAGYIFVAAVYGVILMVCYFRGMLAIRYDRFVLYPVVALWAIFLITFIMDPTTMTGLRTAAFIIFTGITLFVLPATFSKEQFVDALGIVATTIAALAIPVAIPAIQAGSSGFGVWRWDDGIPVLMSIFTNPNHLSALSAFGVVALFGVARTRQRDRWAALCAVVCLVGLVASQGRASLLGFIGAFALIIAYRFIGLRAVGVLVSIGIVGGAVFFMLAFGDIFGVGVPNSVFDRRVPIWIATVQAISDQPILGWGLGDDAHIVLQYGGSSLRPGAHSTHNSYLRMFLDGGIIGGFLYLTLCAVALKRAFETLRESIPCRDVNYVFLPLLAIVLTIQLFEGSTIFGLSFESVIPALIVGYVSCEECVFRIDSTTVTRLIASIRRGDTNKDIS